MFLLSRHRTRLHKTILIVPMKDNKKNGKPDPKTNMCYKCHKARHMATNWSKNNSALSPHFLKGVEDDKKVTQYGDAQGGKLYKWRQRASR